MKENELNLPDEIVISKIYLIRNQKVMLDSDLASLYEVDTKQLKRQVKRNLERFPADFMFELTGIENENLRCQIGASSWGGSRYVPMAFTEHGVLMLSSVLGSAKAVQVNIQIMRIFTKIRQTLTDTTELRLAIEEIRHRTNNNTKNIEVVFQYFDELLEKKEKAKPRKQIGYRLSKKKTGN
jgi:ORF6N domain-containing protein